MDGDILVYDIETKETFQQVGSRDPKKLHISVIGAYSYNEKRLIGLKEEELGDFWRRLERCKMVIGFNNHGFDDLVCAAYFPEMEKVASFDMLAAVEKSLGHRVKLDTLAKATLGSQKSGDGLQAVQMYADGKIDEILQYCLDDVAITQKLYEYGRHRRSLSFADFSGETKEFPVDFSWEPEEQKALNLSLF